MPVKSKAQSFSFTARTLIPATDLYDNLEKIPFDRIEAFFREYLK